jgi:hypothetical protein
MSLGSLYPASPTVWVGDWSCVYSPITPWVPYAWFVTHRYISTCIRLVVAYGLVYRCPALIANSPFPPGSLAGDSHDFFDAGDWDSDQPDDRNFLDRPISGPKNFLQSQTWWPFTSEDGVSMEFEDLHFLDRKGRPLLRPPNHSFAPCHWDRLGGLAVTTWQTLMYLFISSAFFPFKIIHDTNEKPRTYNFTLQE